jgi:hypothetical protein
VAWSRVARALGALLLACAVLVAAAALNLEALVVSALTPGAPFDAAAAPPAPDYADGAAWSALPGRVDAADARPDSVNPPADVFYVHPTSYLGSNWLSDVRDARLAADTDRVGTRIQASAFDACCAVYAPRYRQSNGTAFFAPSADGHLARDASYGDVKAAFAAFQARRGSERPFLLVAHSQGAALARRLLAEEIAPSPARDQLVAAWLIGVPALVSELGVPVCKAPDQTGCAIVYNARAPGVQPGLFQILDERPGERACVNPLTWTVDGRAPASANRGAVFVEFDPFVHLPAFAGASCEDGVLRVTDVGTAPRDLPSRILDRVMGAGNHHPIEFQMFYEDLRANAAERVAAWGRAE